MNNRTANLMASSKSVEWPTDPEFFAKLDKEFQFTLDPCATAENAKCAKFFTMEQDGLKQSWAGERVFMNPPYGRGMGKWMKKAYEESLKGALVVCLIPARTDTHLWHEYAVKGKIRFIRGRLRFGDRKWVAPFPSAVIIFRREYDIQQKSNTPFEQMEFQYNGEGKL